MRRPHTGGAIATTPRASEVVELLGGVTHGGNVFSRDELAALNRLYRMVEERPNARPPEPLPPVPPPVPPDGSSRETLAAHCAAERAHEAALRSHERTHRQWERWTDPRAFYAAGAERNMFRHAEADGMRMIAWIARYTAPGEDPLKAVVRMAIDAGMDVDPSDVAWCEEEDG